MSVRPIPEALPPLTPHLVVRDACAALDHYRDTHRVFCRWITGALGAFIVLLGVLRFAFLATVGYGGDLAALFHELSLQGKLAGFQVYERFYEIGSPAGLHDFEQYLEAASHLVP